MICNKETLSKIIMLFTSVLALSTTACNPGNEDNDPTRLGLLLASLSGPTQITWQIDADLAGSNPSTFTVGVIGVGNGRYGLFGLSCYVLQESPRIEDCGPIEGNAVFVNGVLDVSLDTTDANDKGTADTSDDFHGSVHHHFLLDPSTLNGTFDAIGVVRNGSVSTDVAYTGTVTAR